MNKKYRLGCIIQGAIRISTMVTSRRSESSDISFFEKLEKYDGRTNTHTDIQTYRWMDGQTDITAVLSLLAGD